MIYFKHHSCHKTLSHVISESHSTSCRISAECFEYEAPVRVGLFRAMPGCVGLCRAVHDYVGVCRVM